MTQLHYDYYVDIVTKRYFHAVDNFDLRTVLDCFHPDASLREMTSNSMHAGIRDIERMFVGLFDAHSRLWHGNFVHTVDVPGQSICSQFSVEVTPKATGSELRLENCNRFYLMHGKFARVYVYMSGDNLLK